MALTTMTTEPNTAHAMGFRLRRLNIDRRRGIVAVFVTKLRLHSRAHACEGACLIDSGGLVTESKVEHGARPETEGVYYNLPGVAVVRWDPPSQAAHIEWQGWANPAEFKAANNALIRAIREHRSSRILGDSRRIKAIQKSDQDWANREWFPRIIAAGLRQLAMVLPESGIALMNIKDIVSKVPGTDLEVAYFPTLEKAREWLTPS
jgi:hypothetical protein